MDVSVRIMEFLLEFHLTFHDAGIFPYIMEGTPLFCIFSENNKNPLAPDCFKGQGVFHQIVVLYFLYCFAMQLFIIDLRQIPFLHDSAFCINLHDI